MKIKYHFMKQKYLSKNVDKIACHYGIIAWEKTTTNSMSLT
jgi:hypothetical protein